MDPVAQLRQLEDRIADLAGLVERIRTATIGLFASTPPQRDDLVALVQDASAEADAIRAEASRLFAAAGLPLAWADKEVLLGSLGTARDLFVAKQASAALAGIRKLADSLEMGRVTHQLARSRERLNALRQKAVEELRTTDGPSVCPLPGPAETDDWLGWFWGAGDAAEEAVDQLRDRFAALATFLEAVTREQWRPGTVATVESAVFQDAAVVAAGMGVSHPSVPPLRICPEPATTTNDQPTPSPDLSGAAPSLPPSKPSGVADTFSDSSPGTGSAGNGECGQTDTIPPAPAPGVDGGTEPLGGHGQDRSEPITEHAPATDEEAVEVRQLPRRAELGPPPILPSDEATFEEFCKQHWVAPDGTCQAAPWRLPGFADHLIDALFKSLESESFGRAIVFAAAAAELRCESVPTPEEVEAWARLWQRPREAMGLGSAFVSLLRAAAGEGKLNAGRDWKLRLCIEALRPSPDLPLGDSEARRWVDAAGFESGALREMLVLLLRIGRSTDRPIDEIRRVRKAGGPVFANLARDLEEKRRVFHAEVRRVWSAAGGKVMMTHCRRAWDDFIAQIKPTIEVLYPPNLGGEPAWDSEDLERQIRRFTRIHKEIADRRGAKFGDRHTMERTAQSIAAMAMEINSLHSRLTAAAVAHKARLVSDEEVASRTEVFLGETSREDDFEACCRRMIIRHIEAQTGPEPRTGLTVDDLLAYPTLLGCVAGDLDLPPGSPGQEAVPFTDILSPTAAAAVLLQPAKPCPALGQGEKLVDRLASLLLPLRRHDLLAPLVPLLAGSDQAKVRAARNEAMADTMKVYGEIRRAWERLGDLASAKEDSPLKKALEEAGRRVKATSPDEAARPADQLCFKGWLERVNAYAGRVLAYAVEAFRNAILREGHSDEADILRALDEGRYDDAMFLRSEASVDKSSSTAARRQTLWRKLARARFPDPSHELKTFRQKLKQPTQGHSNLDELIGKWLVGVAGSLSEDQRLRTKFADVVFADTLAGMFKGESIRRQGRSDAIHFKIPCQKVRDYLAHQGLNPTFLPQLARSEEFVFVTPPAKVSDPGLVQQTANLIAGSYPNKLVAILAPRISAEQRSALLHELRQRKLTAGVVDSLDLCRLLNVGGRQINLVIGLLELMLEQQRWGDTSPFHAHDGAQARIEMYVGRAQEANVLATDNKYSRLFSGRKLGKSALLKFIEERYDGSRLPSGNTLRVLRIPIVGIQSDAMVVNKVLAELRARLTFHPPAPTENAVDAFLDALGAFLKSRPGDSLLVILDEADVFIEKQLEEYELHQERCLSFRLRSDAQKEVDRQGLPRVRFVFAGYRKANTRGGAWGNWGDPLLLNPLEADEAADLIAGPLARLGIDAADVAPSIAYRCGYQPAVLLRFGERLLDVLDNRFPDVARREHVIVTAAHVAEVYQHQAIQDEIRTVVRNNFQGNDAGQAVFSATLLAFANLAPGDALPNAPENIWRRLRELIEGNPDVTQAAAGIGWLTPRAGEAGGPSEVGLNEVKKHLEDFHERKLLVLVNRDDGVYKLRFPYHLSSLLVGVQDEAWAALLRLGRGTASSQADERTGDPISPPTLRDLHTVLRKYEDLGLHYRAAVLGTLWPDSVGDPDWLANRLGFDPGRLSGPGQSRNLAAAAYLEVNAAEAQHLLVSRPVEAPPAFLVGGVDLLRWGMRAAQGGEAVEVHGQARLSRSSVERWFRRKREFGFDRDEVDQISRMTGRIPYLIHLLDRCLREAVGADGGVHVGPEEFEKGAAKFERRLADHLGLLASGTDAVRLSAREVELLLMAVVVARTGEFKHLVTYQDLGEYWEGMLYEEPWMKEFPGRHYPRAWTDEVEDRLAAKVVAELGLLPHPLDQPPTDTPLTAEDPLVRVIVPALARAGG